MASYLSLPYRSVVIAPKTHQPSHHLSPIPSTPLTGLAMEARAHLSRVQILSHQSKIASKIELYIGDGPSYEQVRGLHASVRGSVPHTYINAFRQPTRLTRPDLTRIQYIQPLLTRRRTSSGWGT